MKLDGTRSSLELDTGAGVTLISEEQYKRDFSHIPLESGDLPLLQTYTCDNVPVLGKIQIDVDYKEQHISLPLHVVAGNGPALLGRNWMSCLQLDWREIGNSLNSVKIENSKAEPKLDELLSKYSSLFDGSLGTVKGVKLHLSVKADAKPKFYKARTVPYALQDKVSEELDRLESIGVIEKVDYSEWAAPIVPVIKPSGAVRICGDYKLTINQDLEVPQYPLPVAEDLLNKMNGGEKFTKLDLSHAYQQILLDDESKKYVTINTHKGLYRYTRLPFGVASAPAQFQQVIDQTLQGLSSTGAFMDDLYVTGPKDEPHLQNLEKVFKCLDDRGIKLNKARCHFQKPSIEYLGYRVDSDGIHPTNSKIDAIRNAPRPSCVKELQSFLGLVNYYRKFITNMSTLCSPLNRLLQKGATFDWTDECESVYQELCSYLTTSDVLVHYDPEKTLILAVDASQYGLGAVISHETSQGERPIAYASRTLTSAEKNYSQVEKEALAIIYGLQKFHKYLFGRRFILYTDHKPLVTILGPKTGVPVLAATRLQRWAIQLSAYTYEIKYKTSKQNANADCLSRMPLRGDEPELESHHTFWTKEASSVHCAQIENLPVKAKDIAAGSKKDSVMCKVMHFTVTGWPTEKEVSADLLPYYRRRDELTCEENCLLWGIRVIVPPQYRTKVLENMHDAHPGIVKMKSLARIHVWWPNIDAEIENMVRNCSACQSVQPLPAKTRDNPWTWPTHPYQRIHVDFAGPFIGTNFLIVVDARSKWPEVIPMNSTTSSNTIAVLRRLFAANGIPNQLVSDNGPQFTSNEFAVFLKKNGVQHILSSPYHPSSNGEAERFVRTFKTTMKSMKTTPGSLDRNISKFLLSYRTTPHSTTKTTPAELLMGRRLRTRMDLLKPDLSTSIQLKGKKFTEGRKGVKREFEVGDPVLVRDYRGQKETWVKGVVIKVLGPVTYNVQVENYIWKRHVDQLLSETGMCPVPVSNHDVVIDDGGVDLPSRSQSVSDSVVPSGANGEMNVNPEDTVTSVPSDKGEMCATSGTAQVEQTRRYPTRERKAPERLTYE